MMFAPSLLFFAVTGALQLFNLHETRPGRSFEPPAIFQELGMVHKDQVFVMPRRKAPRPPSSEVGGPANAVATQGPPATPPEAERPSSWKPLALKVFFLFAAIGLFFSTCLGIWIGLRPGRNRGLALGLLASGAVIPVLLLAL